MRSECPPPASQVDRILTCVIIVSLWFPTMSLAIEFKRRIPSDFLLSRWGHISRNQFIFDGQFDNSVSVALTSSREHN